MTIGRHRTFRRAGRAGLWLLAACLLALAAAAGEREEIAALVEEGRHREALERLEAHLRDDPEDLEARFLQGVALAELGELEEAIAVFSALAEEHPKLAELHNNLAVLHATRGEYEAARTALLAAVENAPESSRYRENLGDLYANLAAEAYGRAAELGAPEGRAEAKRQRIEELLADPRAAPSADAGSDEPAPPAEASACAGALAAVDGWAAAWSRRDVERYLGHYADAFTPAGGETREGWEAERRRRLAVPGFVAVAVADPVVEVCAERRARLTFTQTYCSDRYGDRVKKELWMSRTGDRWQIVGERVLGDDRGGPAPPPAVTAPPSRVASAAGASELYRVQLGSCQERVRAEQDLARFREVHSALLGALPARVDRVDLGAKGVWYRIQFGEFRSRPEAESLCRRLEKRGQDCLIAVGGRIR